MDCVAVAGYRSSAIESYYKRLSNRLSIITEGVDKLSGSAMKIDEGMPLMFRLE